MFANLLRRRPAAPANLIVADTIPASLLVSTDAMIARHVANRLNGGR